MKRTLLLLPLLCGSAVSFAQTPLRTTVAGPWTGVNTSSIRTAANVQMNQLVTLSSTFAWGIGDDVPTRNGGASYLSMRATNAAGTEFDSNPIYASPGFATANISVPAGVPGNPIAYCAQFGYGPTNGGPSQVVRTLNGGVSWRVIAPPALFGGPIGFCNWAYAFSSGNVVAGGDPIVSGSGGGIAPFEIWYSTNADTPLASAVTWTRATAPAPLSADEYLLVHSYTALGNTIWAGTNNSTPFGVPSPARVLRSTDQGHTWTAANTPMSGSIDRLAFKDQLNGIAYSVKATGIEVMYTTNGGLTWVVDLANPDPTTADTLQGKLYTAGIDAIPNLGYVSYGTALPRNYRLSNRGASFSRTGHGLTWTDIDKGRDLYTAADFISCGSGGYQGYLGGYTSATGSGGLYQIANTCALLATKATAPRPALLTAAPNPSLDGQFRLDFTEAIQPGTHLAVVDALGRPVLACTLAASAMGSDTAPLDLTHQPPGIYTLRLTTPAGTATHKLVIQ